MAKKELLATQKKSMHEMLRPGLKKNIQVRRHDLLDNLPDESKVAQAVFECLRDNDPDGLVEIIQIYLDALNKSRFLKKARVPRSTMYNLLKTRNPTIKTLAKIVHAGCNA
jgi:DNA-binding phage protein